MLWAAGQKRTGREARNRMTETYVAFRDGYVAARLGSKAGQPDYTKGEGPKRSGLAKLLADFPSAVVGKPEFKT